MLISLTLVLLLTGCRGGGDDGVGDEFPPYPDASFIKSDEVDSDDLPFVGSDAVAALYVSDERPDTVSIHYAQRAGDTGWERTDSYGSGLALTTIFTKGSRTAQVIVISGIALNVQQSYLDTIATPPFDISDMPVDVHGTLIYTRIATCDEPELNICVEAQ